MSQKTVGNMTYQELRREIRETTAPLFKETNTKIEQLAEKSQAQFQQAAEKTQAQFQQAAEKTQAQFQRAAEETQAQFERVIETTQSQIHRLAVLQEQMNFKIDLALDVSKETALHGQIIPHHENRIGRLETDMKLVKMALAKKKS
jgi:hypothetical protein